MEPDSTKNDEIDVVHSLSLTVPIQSSSDNCDRCILLQYDTLCFIQVFILQLDAADIVGSQHLQEKSQKYEHHIKELQSQILNLTQRRDDLGAELEVCESIDYFPC